MTDTFNIGFAIKPKLGIIYRFQRDNNLTCKALAELIGVPSNWLSSIINMRIIPKTDKGGTNITKLLNFFGCQFDELFPSQDLKMLGGEYSIFQDIPKDKLVSWTDKKFDLLPAPTTIDVNYMDVTIEKVLEKLRPQEAEIIKLRFGINCKKATMEKIGVMFGISRARVNQIEKRALRKLRHPSIAKMLKEYLV